MRFSCLRSESLSLMYSFSLRRMYPPLLSRTIARSCDILTICLSVRGISPSSSNHPPKWLAETSHLEVSASISFNGFPSGHSMKNRFSLLFLRSKTSSNPFRSNNISGSLELNRTLGIMFENSRLSVFNAVFSWFSFLTTSKRLLSLES